MSEYRVLASRLIGARIEYEIGGQKRFKAIKGLAETVPQEGKRSAAYVNVRDQHFMLKGKRDGNGNLVGMSTNLKNEFERRSRGANEYRISVKDYFKLRKFTVIHP